MRCSHDTDTNATVQFLRIDKSAVKLFEMRFKYST